MTSAKCCGVVLCFFFFVISETVVCTSDLKKQKFLFLTSPNQHNGVIYYLHVDFFGGFDGDVCHGEL